MRVLILEDAQYRIDQFRKNLDGLSIWITEDVWELQNQLYSIPTDVLFLDHDLGGEVYVDVEREDSGSGVARWLNKMPGLIPPLVIIHSKNQIGRLYMKQLLPTAVIYENAWEIFTKAVLEDEKCKETLARLAKYQAARLEQYGTL
jgi:hypothetical protein